MENLLINLQQPLEFLIFTTIITSILITVFLVKLLIDLSNLSKSADNFISIVKHEIEPTIKEFKKALANINAVANTADYQVTNINKSIAKGMNVLSGSTTDVFNKTRILTACVKQGILTGLKVLLSKK